MSSNWGPSLSSGARGLAESKLKEASKSCTMSHRERGFSLLVPPYVLACHVETGLKSIDKHEQVGVHHCQFFLTKIETVTKMKSWVFISVISAQMCSSLSNGLNRIEIFAEMKRSVFTFVNSFSNYSFLQKQHEKCSFLSFPRKFQKFKKRQPQTTF